MARGVTLPTLGENIEEGEVISVLVKPGETVTEGQALLELETDKATVEVPPKGEGEPIKKDIKVGLSDGINIEVADGLRLKDQVVERPPQKLE